MSWFFTFLTISASHSWAHSCGWWSAPRCPCGSCRSPYRCLDLDSTDRCERSTAPSFDSYRQLVQDLNQEKHYLLWCASWWMPWRNGLLAMLLNFQVLVEVRMPGQVCLLYSVGIYNKCYIKHLLLSCLLALLARQVKYAQTSLFVCGVGYCLWLWQEHR